MPPRKRRKPAPADQADPRDIHIQASATVGQAEGSHVTGAVVNAPDAEHIQIGDSVAGDKVLGDQVFGDKNVSITNQAPEQTITNQAPNYGAQGIFQGPVYVGTSPPTPLDPVAAAEHLATLPLDTIPDLAPLPPGSRMPLSRNPLFVGREADLKHLAAALKAGTTAAIGQIAAATGLGGIGKTNLATEFVHRYGQYFAGGVFWLSFADAASVPAEVAACGVGLGLPGFESLTLDDQMARVRQTWQEPIPRLLIFDNCEDEALLDAWRPTTGGCRVLVTSRRARWDVALGVKILALDVLPRSESITLLRQFRPDLPPDDPDLDAIAAELGDLPLALHLAGSFLARYRQAITLAEYLAQLRSPMLLQHRSLSLAGVSPTQHDHDVGRTFALSYERLDLNEPTDVLAIKLLVRAAYFAPGEPIPRDLLLATVELPGDDAALTAQDALARLIELGLLEQEDAGALRLHRLLAVFVQAMAQDAEAQAAVEEGIYAVANQLSGAGLPTAFQGLQRHLSFVTDRAMVRDDALAACLCSVLASYLNMIGAYQVARPYVECALAVRRKVLGEQHPDTAASLNNLGYLLRVMGDLIGAQRYLEQAVAIDEAVYGHEHPAVATGLNNLGALFQDMGDLMGAQRYYEQALAIRRKMLGEEHPNTAASLNNLGYLLKARGDLVGAQRYLEQALAIRQKVQGEWHPSTATNLNNLGLLLQDTGDLIGARQYYEQALTIKRAVLGEQHPSTATSLNNLGNLLQAQGDLPGARLYLEQALVICKQGQGQEHPDTARCLNSLGSLLQDTGDLMGARASYEQALAIRRKVLGEEHPDTATSLNNLGMLLQNMGDLEGARPYLEQALTICQRVLGEQHPDTAGSLNNLAVLCAEAERFHEAIPLMQRALTIRETVFGPQHPDTQVSRRSLTAMEQAARQIAAIMQQADAAVTSVMAQGDTEACAILAEQLEQRAQQTESGSPALAAYLRGLIARLRAGNGDDTPGDAG